MFEIARRCGLQFECTQCAFCCTGSPGYIWLTDADIEDLCKFLGLEFEQFVGRYCTYVDIGEARALSLKEKTGYDCVFLERGRCSVYAARPVQCRTYPFWEEILETEANWKDEAKYCPGIGHGSWVQPERMAEALLERRANPRYLDYKIQDREVRP